MPPPSAAIARGERSIRPGAPGIAGRPPGRFRNVLHRDVGPGDVEFAADPGGPVIEYDLDRRRRIQAPVRKLKQRKILADETEFAANAAAGAQWPHANHS